MGHRGLERNDCPSLAHWARGVVSLGNPIITDSNCPEQSQMWQISSTCSCMWTTGVGCSLSWELIPDAQRGWHFLSSSPRSPAFVSSTHREVWL